ncbi:MAG: DUF262 domain-containing protein [Acidobacteriota bacterium]|nr:DUF262 domain-containing protein [Acidobacteriota bacterium]
MPASNFATKNDTYRKLMGNGLTYRIPRFQRDYSWTEDEWEDLWLDIQGTIKEGGEPAHYMGYLVLQSDDEKVFDVIDGQQRLTTLSLIVLAVLKNLQRLIDEGRDANDNQQRLETLRKNYIGYLDPITLIPRSKLTLNRNNDNYYQTYLVPLGRLPQRGFRASEHSLRKAFEWFDKKVSEYARKSSLVEGVALATLVEMVSDRLFFTVITVTDELNAYKVFETLNARGVRLSATDLLKNYLFSVLDRKGQHEHELMKLEDRWEAMVSRLGSESFPDFLRIHWNSRHSFVRQAELFKAIRGQVKTDQEVFKLIRAMEDDVDAYLGLTSPETSSWPPKLKSYAQELKLFGVRQPFPLLLAARRMFNDQQFEPILRAVVMISFRYNVISGLHGNEQEHVYNRVAGKIFNLESTTTNHVLNALSPVYLSDETFRAAFTDKVLRTKQSRNGRIVRYILCELERRLTGQDYDFNSDTFNLEHVLPQNPGAGWDQFSEEEIEAMVFRLGNMTLLQSSANRDHGNEDYATKRPVYAQSGFAVTRKLAQENAEWNPERLAARQAWMAKQAIAIWQISQLS